MSSIKDEKKWITVRGRKVPVDPDETAQEALQEKMPSARGEKERATKESRKEIEKRMYVVKTPFNTRDEVIFDNFTREGILFGFDGDYVKIRSGSGTYDRLAKDVFKKSELIDGLHWDAISSRKRVEILEKSMYQVDYKNLDWSMLPRIMRDKMTKNLGPAGYEGGVSTQTPGVYNPVHSDKTVAERLNESLSQQHEKPKTETKPDPKKQVID